MRDPTSVAWHTCKTMMTQLLRRRSWSTLAQVIACCLTTPSLNLNQYWRTISDIIWHPLQGEVSFNTQDNNPHVVFEICLFESQPLLPVASFTKEINPRLAKRPLVCNGCLVNHGITFLVKEATEDNDSRGKWVKLVGRGPGQIVFAEVKLYRSRSQDQGPIRYTSSWHRDHRHAIRRVSLNITKLIGHVALGPLLLTWISHHMASKVWDGTSTVPPLKFGNGISNFIPHVIMDVITYPYQD